VIGMPTPTTAGECDTDRGIDQLRVDLDDALTRCGDRNHGGLISPSDGSKQVVAVRDKPPPAPKLDESAYALRRPVEVQPVVRTVAVDLFRQGRGNHGPDPILMLVKEGIIAV